MRIAIIGIGAMGCLFGARLAPLADVVMVGTWPEGLAALRERGITLADAQGERTIPVQVADAAASPPCDLALILVKSYQTARAARQAAEWLAPQGLALTLQNGLGNDEVLAASLGAARVALGVTAQGAMLLGPGRVYHAGVGLTHLGVTPLTRERLAEVGALFRQAGLETHLTENIAGLVWGKLVVNSAINPLTALLRVPNGALLQNERARALMEAVAWETAHVAQAQGIRLPFDDPAERVREVAARTAHNRSSMLQDVLRGAPTEIEAINGAVVRAGQRLGVPTPINATLWRLVCALEATRPLRQI
ncbi:MAG: 2-dehydropantoate 2-reductase [Chloroflexota bacterium]